MQTKLASVTIASIKVVGKCHYCGKSIDANEDYTYVSSHFVCENCQYNALPSHKGHKKAGRTAKYPDLP
jgi:Zn finger protein HypA/HybF involved in hydrogenase expression